MFCWQLLRGRTAVKEQLVCRGLLDQNLTFCTFYKVKYELIGHLFFACSFSWKLWTHCFSTWVVHNDPMFMFLVWQQALPDKSGKKLWLMSFFAIIWSIWLMRNDMVFNGKAFDLEQIIDIFKFRLASWFKVKWPKTPHSILDIVKFSKDIQVPKGVQSQQEDHSLGNPTS